MTPRILIVEDEEPLTLLLRYNLEAEGYAVDTVGARRRGRDRGSSENVARPASCSTGCCPASPASSSAGGCARATDTAQLPIIMLTARGEESERVRGLADRRRRLRRQAVLGARADGARPRAAAPRAARARSPSVLERRRPRARPRDEARVARGSREVHLGPTEFRLLEFLMQSPGRVFSREQLLDGVWGRDVYIDERTVDVHVGRLRKRAQPRPRARPDPHRARRRLLVRRAVRQERVAARLSRRRRVAVCPPCDSPC